MIRIVFLLRRQPSMSLGEFQAYWRDTHAPLVASFRTALDIRRYVQLHTLDGEINERLPGARGTMEPAYDGVAELWWDGIEAMEAALATAEGQAAGAALLEDEARFIDLPNSPLWLGVEYPQINPVERIIATPRSSLLKLHFPLRARADLGEEQAAEYWRTQHGPIIRSQAQASGILRYQQVHRLDHPIGDALRESRGTVAAPYLGHAEVWFDRSRNTNTPEGRAAGERAVEDESKFIDFERSALFVGKEHAIIDER